MTAERTIRVVLPDGSARELPAGATGLDLAAAIGKRLHADALGIAVGERIQDVRTPLAPGGRAGPEAPVTVLTSKDPRALDVLRHSASHVLAQAVKRLFPATNLAIGPVIEDGFYYDVDPGRELHPADLAAIEEEMTRVVAEDHPIGRFVLPRAEARAWAAAEGGPFKAELIDALPQDAEISFYRQGEFTDLCEGPHLQRTAQLGRAFKLQKVAGAYWRGDETRPQLQRIYGTAWFRDADLQDHLHRLEEAAKRDHRRLGRELDLFSFDPVAPAMPFFHPKGAVVYNLLVDFVRGLYAKYGYQEVITPQVLDVGLWRTSGHYDHYRDNMYFTETDERISAVKPMNCPTHCVLFRARKRSYRDLPLRFADFGRLHRHERSGVTAGLFRVRSFSQDDAHIFCTRDQVRREVIAVIDMVLETYRVFGFRDVRIMLSTRPAGSLGSDEMWERSERALAEALEERGVEYRLDSGEGSFYGPKIDFSVADALKRRWQLGTCQLDESSPERFDLRYTAASGAEERPVMIHRAMLGSLERFLGVLIEHTGGALPVWLAPVQARVLSIAEGQAARAHELVEFLREHGVRAEADVRNEKVGLKVREATLDRVPFHLIIGARELEHGTVAVRARTDGDLGAMTPEAFLDLLLPKVRDRQ